MKQGVIRDHNGPIRNANVNFEQTYFQHIAVDVEGSPNQKCSTSSGTMPAHRRRRLHMSWQANCSLPSMSRRAPVASSSRCVTSGRASWHGVMRGFLLRSVENIGTALECLMMTDGRVALCAKAVRQALGFRGNWFHVIWLFEDRSAYQKYHISTDLSNDLRMIVRPGYIQSVRGVDYPLGELDARRLLALEPCPSAIFAVSDT
jgi:hypothetical protein